MSPAYIKLGSLNVSFSQQEIPLSTPKNNKYPVLVASVMSIFALTITAITCCIFSSLGFSVGASASLFLAAIAIVSASTLILLLIRLTHSKPTDHFNPKDAQICNLVEIKQMSHKVIVSLRSEIQSLKDSNVSLKNRNELLENAYAQLKKKCCDLSAEVDGYKDAFTKTATLYEQGCPSSPSNSKPKRSFFKK